VTPAPEPLRVCIDARLVSGDRGGVEQVIIGLAHGLSRLDGPERYLFLVDEGHAAWLEPYVAGPCSFLVVPASAAAAPSLAARGRRIVRGVARRVLPARLRPMPRAVPFALPVSDGLAEAAGVNLVHFPMQVGFRTELPTIFTPHDLQHLHLPEFFTVAQIAEREARYRALCERAAAVVMMSSWGKGDIVARYGLAPEKVRVVPGAATLDAYRAPSPEAIAAVRARLSLPGRFGIYPAKAWPHKNHGRLVEALAALRSRGIDVPVVLTGSQGGRDLPVLEHARALGVADLVRFVGFVSPDDLGALYRAADLLVFPSLFEGWGLPILEAMAAGLPVACSAVTCLPAQTAGAALLFDPADPNAIADAVAAAWTNPALRSELASNGRARAAQFSWLDVARTYRAMYRQLCGRPLSPEEVGMLEAAPLV
jgi:glycosyltransferase involved in cell wall biosynthesis